MATLAEATINSEGQIILTADPNSLAAAGIYIYTPIYIYIYIYIYIHTHYIFCSVVLYFLKSIKDVDHCNRKEHAF